MDYSNSRSSAGKVSLLTIGQQAVMDSYLCLMHLTTGVCVCVCVCVCVYSYVSYLCLTHLPTCVCVCVCIVM